MRLDKILFLSSLLLTAAESGITTANITLGQSAAFSGPAQELGKGMHDGTQAYFAQINASSRVFGRKIVLKTLDDGYELERAAANTRQFIKQGDVLALFGYVGTPTSNACQCWNEDVPNGSLNVYQFGLINRAVQALDFSLFTPHFTERQNWG